MKNCFIEKGEEAREEESLEFVMNGFSEEIINSALSKNLPTVSEIGRMFPGENIGIHEQILRGLLIEKKDRYMFYKELEGLGERYASIEDTFNYFCIRNESDGIFNDDDYYLQSIINEMIVRYPILGEAYNRFMAYKE